MKILDVVSVVMIVGRNLKPTQVHFFFCKSKFLAFYLKILLLKKFKLRLCYDLWYYG